MWLAVIFLVYSGRFLWVGRHADKAYQAGERNVRKYRQQHQSHLIFILQLYSMPGNSLIQLQIAHVYGVVFRSQRCHGLEKTSCDLQCTPSLCDTGQKDPTAVPECTSSHTLQFNTTSYMSAVTLS
jgi:hypothetical protein